MIYTNARFTNKKKKEFYGMYEFLLLLPNSTLTYSNLVINNENFLH